MFLSTRINSEFILSMEIIDKLFIAYEVIISFVLWIWLICFGCFGKFVGFVGFTAAEAQADFKDCVRLYFIKHLHLFMSSLEPFNHADELFVFFTSFFEHARIGLLHKYIKYKPLILLGNRLKHFAKLPTWILYLNNVDTIFRKYWLYNRKTSGKVKVSSSGDQPLSVSNRTSHFKK